MSECRRTAARVVVAALFAAVACGRVQSPAPNDASDGGGTPDAARKKCTFQGFDPAVTYPTTNEGISLAVVDRTGSGHLDLVVGERSSSGTNSEFLKNVGDGTFVISASYGASANHVDNLVSADFDGDGKIDLASQSNGAIDLDMGVRGGFAPELVSIPTPHADGSLLTGDYDNDGHPDLVYLGYDEVESGGPGLPVPEPANFALSVFLNDGGGTFGIAVTSALAEQLQSIASGDFDGDGRLDVAAITSQGVDSDVAVFFNAGSGGFQNPVSSLVSATWIAYGLGVSDFDADGIDDMATTTTLNANLPGEKGVLQVFPGTRIHQLGNAAEYTLPRTPTVYRIVTGDFNGDARPDLAMVIGQTPTGALLDPIPVNVFENLGDGTFAPAVTYGVPGADSAAATDVAAGDFNGDGVTDIAVATSGEMAPYPVAVQVLLSKCN